ncbi:His-Xaa-Ser repeat protein HxsA [Jannaschia sp. M317]|uniref:His-Xaa-Ser repeat protein HxsA n=1 Tax=Jannaschia sp. M317 TaxID=2867011 RepID=UPI0021A35EF2|nr:His-Xaa-Ser repeat protein HxsA [Jannaschia sp. M317]UWQ19278.1 His-Xaa-Ser repeat protein HxsA [Jannaschia sp. M317]
MNKKYLIPSLLAAGFTSSGAHAALPVDPMVTDDAKTSLFALFRQQHTYTLAGHRSHSSHGSHSSHRSSSGGGYSAPRAAPAITPRSAAPAPLYTPPTNRNTTSTPPASVLPSPSASAPRVLPGNSGSFQKIAMQVQAALQAYGYYNGAIDGIIGDGSKSALSRFQSDFSLAVTGTITPEVLDAFGITAN